MRKIMISIGILIILIGIVSAGLVEYYGRVVQSVEVESPVFYASDGHPPPGTGYIRWNLTINNYIEKSEPTSFTSTEKWFISESLGISSFYEAQYNIDLDVKADKEDQINSEIWFVDESYDKKIFVCGINTNSLVLSREVHSISCQGESITGIDPSYRLALILEGQNKSVKHYVYMQGKTKIEVSIA